MSDPLAGANPAALLRLIVHTTLLAAWLFVLAGWLFVLGLCLTEMRSDVIFGCALLVWGAQLICAATRLRKEL